MSCRLPFTNLTSSNLTSLEPRNFSISDLAKPRNQALLDGSWLNDIVWDSLAKQQDLEEVEEMVRRKCIVQ